MADNHACLVCPAPACRARQRCTDRARARTHRPRLNWFLQATAYNGLLYYLPSLFAKDEALDARGHRQPDGDAVYIDILLSALAEVPGIFLPMWMVDVQWLGRRGSLWVLQLLGGSACVAAFAIRDGIPPLAPLGATKCRLWRADAVCLSRQTRSWLRARAWRSSPSPPALTCCTCTPVRCFPRESGPQVRWRVAGAGAPA